MQHKVRLLVCSFVRSFVRSLVKVRMLFELRAVLFLMCIGPCIILITEEYNPTRCHLLLYYVRLNMFRAPLCPSSGAHDDSVGYHIGRLVLELLLVGS